MKKILIIAGIAVVLTSGYFIYWQSQPSSEEVYVSTIDSEITALRDELETVDRQISNGTLDPDTAVTAKATIVTRLDALNTAVATAQEGKLQEAERLTLLDGLTRFNKTLRDYQSTMLIVEQTAAQSDNADDGVSLVATLGTTIATFSEISDNIQGYFEETIPEDFNSNEAIDESSLSAEELQAMASSSSEGDTSVDDIEVNSSSEVEISPVVD